MTSLTTKYDKQDEIETPFYRIELGKGGVKSIFDKVSDHLAEWDVVERGAVYTTYKLRQPIRNAVVETNLIVYHDLKKIDFETSLLNWEAILLKLLSW